MNILERINFKQPKYLLPAILYVPLLFASYQIFDLFHTKKAEIPDDTLQVTDYLNAEIPDAIIKGGDGIGSKYENMTKSWGKIADYSAVDIIEREDPAEYQEQYESQYKAEDLLQLDETEQSAGDSEAATQAQREQEAIAELEKALAEARLLGRQNVEQSLGGLDIDSEDNNEQEAVQEPIIQIKGTVSEKHSDAVTALSDSDRTEEVAKVIKKPADYFNTISQDMAEPKMIKAIIDENIKVTDGSRVRLRLLDNIVISGVTVRKGSYLYAIMSGFSSQRVKGNINSVMVGDELFKVSLTLYDTDGMEGLYVPQSQFRETSKDVAGSAMTGNMNFNNGGTAENTLAQWGIQAMQNAYQRTTNAISKSIRRNKVSLKYGTFVYVINSKEIK